MSDGPWMTGQKAIDKMVQTAQGRGGDDPLVALYRNAAGETVSVIRARADYGPMVDDDRIIRAGDGIVVSAGGDGNPAFEEFVSLERLDAEFTPLDRQGNPIEGGRPGLVARGEDGFLHPEHAHGMLARDRTVIGDAVDAALRRLIADKRPLGDGAEVRQEVAVAIQGAMPGVTAEFWGIGKAIANGFASVVTDPDVAASLAADADYKLGLYADWGRVAAWACVGRKEMDEESRQNLCLRLPRRQTPVGTPRAEPDAELAGVMQVALAEHAEQVRARGHGAPGGAGGQSARPGHPGHGRMAVTADGTELSYGSDGLLETVVNAGKGLCRLVADVARRIAELLRGLFGGGPVPTPSPR